MLVWRVGVVWRCVVCWCGVEDLWLIFVLVGWCSVACWCVGVLWCVGVVVAVCVRRYGVLDLESWCDGLGHGGWCVVLRVCLDVAKDVLLRLVDKPVEKMCCKDVWQRRVV